MTRIFTEFIIRLIGSKDKSCTEYSFRHELILQ